MASLGFVQSNVKRITPPQTAPEKTVIISIPSSSSRRMTKRLCPMMCNWGAICYIFLGCVVLIVLAIAIPVRFALTS